jgi:hypothetical protein
MAECTRLILVYNVFGEVKECKLKRRMNTESTQGI